MGLIMKIIDRKTGGEIQIKFFRTLPEELKHLPWGDEEAVYSKTWLLFEIAIVLIGLAMAGGAVWFLFSNQI